MAKPYSVIINNGTGEEEVLKGEYTVTAEATGYDNSSITPASVNITDEGSYDFTIAATGTLTIHVTEEGTSSGTAVEGATFYRTDSTGTTYGDAIASNAEGNAVFNNVPYAAADAPVIYYKQTASDGEHEFTETVQNTTLTASTSTVELANPKAASKTFNLTDTNYANLPINNATITLS